MKTLIILIVFSVVFVLGTFTVSGETAVGGDPATFYANCIDRKITCCDCKGELWHSRSKNLRSCSRLAILKAIFLSANKEQLIREMEASGVAMKTYKVDYYLNKRFYENLNASFLTAKSMD
ncbi:MAG: hypothetical protein WBN03_20505 [Desulfobacterales bacterium]